MKAKLKTTEVVLFYPAANLRSRAPCAVVSREGELRVVAFFPHAAPRVLGRARVPPRPGSPLGRTSAPRAALKNRIAVQHHLPHARAPRRCPALATAVAPPSPPSASSALLSCTRKSRHVAASCTRELRIAVPSTSFAPPIRTPWPSCVSNIHVTVKFSQHPTIAGVKLFPSAVVCNHDVNLRTAMLDLFR
ncbi:hypothetical protein EJB05_35597, partial [Eragrostis curvula]